MNHKNRSKFMLNQLQRSNYLQMQMFTQKNNAKTFNVKTYFQLLKRRKTTQFSMVFKLCTYKEHKTLRWIQFDFLNRLKLLRFMASSMCVRVMSISGVPRNWLYIEQIRMYQVLENRILYFVQIPNMHDELVNY